MPPKILFPIVSMLTPITSVITHNESTQGYYGLEIMLNSDGSWMHNSGHMVGYNMWEIGWFGLITWLLIWALIILGIIYLYQKITENSNQEE